MASIKEMVENNTDEINRHLTAIADILGSAGMGDPINHIIIKFPELQNFFVTWNRNNDPLTEENRKNIREAKEIQEDFEQKFGGAALPGPYKTDPLNGTAMRVDSDQPPYVVITDIFGGHQGQILRSEWEEWKDAPSTN